MSESIPSLQQAMEAEYPLLDSSLLAALISDLPQTANNPNEAIEYLRHTLSQLSVTAEVQQADSESLKGIQTNGVDVGTSSTTHPDSGNTRGSEGGSRSDDLLSSCSGNHTSQTDVTSTSMPTASLSALEFLRLLFPKLSERVILHALHECNHMRPKSLILHELSAEKTDISTIIDHLLNLEFIQDLTERGIEETETENESNGWEFVASSKGKRSAKPIRPPKRASIRPMPLVDVRQRQYVIRSVSPPPHSYSDNPWTRLTSLATWLSDLLPQTSPNYFMSYFHAPLPASAVVGTKRKAEADSVRNALTDLVDRQPPGIDEAELRSHITTICDIVLHPESRDIITLNPEQRDSLEADVQLCLVVSRCEFDTALDLIWLLRELEQASEDGDGIVHSTLSAVSTLTDGAVLAASNESEEIESLPDAFKPSINHPPPVAPPPSSTKHPPVASAWTVVKRRKPGNSEIPNSRSESIPPYDPKKKKRKPGATGVKDNPSGPDDNETYYKTQVRELQDRREEALREAMRHWQSGNAKTRGGEVALYYADEARKLQEKQREYALEAARAMVETKRLNSGAHHTLDLHGLTIYEACQIVKEYMELFPPSAGNPVKIITGLGRHSVGQIGVLGPAVGNMLQADGYKVSKFDGSYSVYGKR